MFKTKEIEPREITLTDVLPLLRIEKDVIILKDGRAAIGFEIVGSPFESMSADQYQQFASTFEQASLTLPLHYVVQKLDIYHNAYYPFGRENNLSVDTGFFERETIRYYAERPVLRQKSYLFIISNNVRNKKNNPMTTPFAMKGNIFVKDLNGIEKRIDAVKSNGKAFIESLLSSGFLKASALKGEQIEKLYYQILNLEFKQEVNEPYKAIFNNQNALVVGEKKVNVISMEEQGEEFFFSDINDYGVDAPYTWRFGIYLQFPHITVTSFYVDDTQAELRRLDNQRRINSAFTKVSGQDAQARMAELEAFTMQVRANQQRFLSVSLQVALFTNGEIARENNIQATSDAFRSMYGSKPLVETFDNANAYFACLPGASANTLRWLLMTSDCASSYINITNEFLSKRSGDYVADRFRNLVYINMFDRSLNNQNAIIIGPSGSGKSFTKGHFILQRFERKERQIIIDVGGTYKNVIQFLNGKYFEYDPQNPISFNPFLTGLKEDGTYSPDDDKVSFIINVIALLWKQKGEGVNNIEWSILQDLIPRYYIHFNKHKDTKVPNIAGFAKWLRDFENDIEKDPSSKRKFDRFDFTALQICLEPFVKGKYKALLNSEDILDISDYKLVCFDMAKVKDDARLYPIVAMLLTELSLDTIRKFPDEIKYFTMDEAWSMLSEAMGDFVEYMYRTLRKANGSMTIITQGIDEIINSKVGNAIINNAETKMILNHTDKTQIEKIGKHLGFTSEEMGKIASIRVNSECREVFLKQGNNSFVFVLEVPSAEHAVLTSNPVERNHLNMLKVIYNNNIEFAIKQWEEDKVNGVIDSKK